MGLVQGLRVTPVTGQHDYAGGAPASSPIHGYRYRFRLSRTSAQSLSESLVPREAYTLAVHGVGLLMASGGSHLPILSLDKSPVDTARLHTVLAARLVRPQAPGFQATGHFQTRGGSVEVLPVLEHAASTMAEVVTGISCQHAGHKVRCNDVQYEYDTTHLSGCPSITRSSNTW